MPVDCYGGPHLLPWRDLSADTRDEVVVRLIGDVHVGAVGFNEKKFIETLREVKEEKQYFLMAGDWLDNANKKQRHGAVYEATMRPKEQRAYVVSRLRDIAPQCVGVIEGNHEAWTTEDFDLSPMGVVAQELGILDRYAGDGLLVRLKFGQVTRTGGRRPPSGSKGKYVSYLLYLTHGRSGSALISGKATSLQRAGDAVVADVICGAHVHQEFMFRDRIYCPDTNDTVSCGYRDRLFVNCSSFLEWGGYAKTARYRPSPPGAPSIILETAREVVGARI